MFIMENPIQMDDLVIFMVITPILGNLYMSKQMLSCTKLAATKSMAWSCDMTRPLLCHFRFRPQNRACGIPNSKRSFLSLSCWSNWSMSQYVTIVYNCHNAQALVLHVLLVLNHTVSSADHSCRIQRMGKQNTCNPKSACRTHTQLAKALHQPGQSTVAGRTTVTGQYTGCFQLLQHRQVNLYTREIHVLLLTHGNVIHDLKQLSSKH